MLNDETKKNNQFKKNNKVKKITIKIIEIKFDKKKARG
jgi:hypothetical protein